MTQERSEALRQLVQDVLPDAWESLDYLLQADAQFLELSQLYDQRVAALRRGLSQEASPEPTEECATQLRSLEQKILRYLDRHSDSPPPDLGEYDDDRR